MRAIVLMRDGSFRLTTAAQTNQRGKADPMMRLIVPRDPRICPRHAHSIKDCCMFEESSHEWVRLVAEDHGWAVYVQAT